MLEVVPYTNDLKKAWNDLVEISKNGSFILFRDYMEYHSDRFEDASLIVRKNEDKTIAVFPANVVESTVYSHQGLTYGGLILNRKASIDDAREALKLVMQHYLEKGFQQMVYKKPFPIYQTVPADEDEYLMYILNAQQRSSECNFVIDMSNQLAFSRGRKGGKNHAQKAGVRIVESDDLKTYWDTILLPMLKEIHDSAPVHSLAEIEALSKSFPKNIKLYSAYVDDEMVAGTLLYIYNNAVHAQYTSATFKGRETRALDLLFYTLIKETFSTSKWFSFGTAFEESSRVFNKGLQEWKEEFGARAYTSNTYEVQLKDVELL